jgi:hypothetical protein
VSDALYVLEDGRFIPGPLTVGPWSPDAQHGGPVAALLARTVESTAPVVPMQVVRLTVELLRPVPISPLVATAVVSRPGKKVQVVDATLEADGTEVARARALRIRSAPVEVTGEPGAQPAELPETPAPAMVPPGAGPAMPSPASRTAFVDAVDLRFVKGSWEELGPVTMWSRLLVPVVAGEEPTPIQRTAAAADFGNGVSRVLDFDTHIFINPDLTVALARRPAGEWIGFDVVSRLSSEGYGQAESLIFDEFGPAGRAIQSLLVEVRVPGPG